MFRYREKTTEARTSVAASLSRIPRVIISCLKTRRLPSAIAYPFKKFVFESLFWDFFIRYLLFLTPTYTVNPQSETDVHCITGKEQVIMCIFALKSFLRFFNNIAVVVHDDGSLDAKSILLLQRHIIGLRIIDRKSAEEKIEQMLPKKSCLAARQWRVNFMLAFDYFIFSSAQKIIGLDTDTLFFEYPREIIDWAQLGEKVNLYSHEETACYFPQDNNYKESMLYKNGEAILSLVQGVNGGLFCAYRNIVNFDIAEKYLDLLISTNNLAKYPSAQNILSLYLSYSVIPYQSLSVSQYKMLANYYFNFRNASYAPSRFRSKSVFKHYNYSAIRYNLKYGYVRDVILVFIELFLSLFS